MQSEARMRVCFRIIYRIFFMVHENLYFVLCCIYLAISLSMSILPKQYLEAGFTSAVHRFVLNNLHLYSQ